MNKLLGYIVDHHIQIETAAVETAEIAAAIVLPEFVAMNSLLKSTVIVALDAFMYFEPSLATHVSASNKVLLDDAVKAVKALIPVIQGL